MSSLRSFDRTIVESEPASKLNKTRAKATLRKDILLQSPGLWDKLDSLAFNWTLKLRTKYVIEQDQLNDSLALLFGVINRQISANIKYITINVDDFPVEVRSDLMWKYVGLVSTLSEPNQCPAGLRRQF